MRRIRELGLEEGRFLVKLARRSVEEYLRKYKIPPPPPETPRSLMEKSGVFVTIEKYVETEEGFVQRVLRGCIGYPRPIKPLAIATMETAVAAATSDPRFPPMTYQELDEVVFEVSVLTEPRLLNPSNPRDLEKMVKVGRDGIIVEKQWASGLLLPQVAVEYEWDEKTFLSQACVKAGLPPDEWERGGVKVYVFQAQIFAEVTPKGDVVERKLLVGEGVK